MCENTRFEMLKDNFLNVKDNFLNVKDNFLNVKDNGKITCLVTCYLIVIFIKLSYNINEVMKWKIKAV